MIRHFRLLVRRSKINGKYWSCQNRTLSQSHPIDKKLLEILRKETGYPVTKCHLALKNSNNDVEVAKEWLAEKAKKEGWTKAQEKSNRSTNQGLVGVVKQENFASLVEVSCETDFVAKNDLFRQLVSSAASSSLNFRKEIILQNQKISSNKDEITHLREMLLQHELAKLPLDKTENSLQDKVAEVIGKVGENIKLKRAVAIATSIDNIIGTAVHGNFSGNFYGCLMGVFASVVVLKPSNQENLDEIQKLSSKLAQHVIGMDPKAIDKTVDIEESDCLLHQEYLLDSKIVVGDLVKSYNCDIVDFIRYSVNELN